MVEIIDYIKNNKIIFFLIVGFIFSVFSLGRFNISISIYIWPFCFLSYLHKSDKKIIPLVYVYLCLLFSNMIRWIGATINNIGVDFLLGFYFSIINVIPFIVDSIFYEKLPKSKSVFVFPLSVAFIEYILSYPPIANFNIYAYAHLDNITIIQIVSLFGCYFLSFIISLFSTVLDYSINVFIIENKISKYIYIYISIFLFIYFFGMIRLIIPNDQNTINIASSLGLSQKLYNDGEESELPIQTYLEYINSTMKKASDSGAVIMTYAEEAFAIKEEDINNILEPVQKMAFEFRIFVALTLDIHYKNESYTNGALLISDEGKILIDYHKKHLVPFGEGGDYFSWKNKMKIVNTKIGKILLAICYDIDFPWDINSQSKKHFDLLIVPSWDYPGIAEYHSKEVRYRAIEGGINVMKNTADGVVAAFDVKGRMLTYFYGQNCEDYFIISTVHNKGIKTLYSYIEIFWNYLYFLALIIVLIHGKIKECLFNKNRNKESNSLNNGNEPNNIL